MSRRPSNEPNRQGRSDDVELVIRPKEKDLGGFSVRRVLPAEDRRMVGPYIFFDHMGPARFPVGEGVDVRPHPHIGMSAVTWLFDGELMHRDSLGYEQPIRPGEMNFMTAGRGIVHSERTPPEERERGASLHGIQLWLGLPVDLEETAPAFTHFSADKIPVTQVENCRVSVIIGEAYGVRSPVETLSPTLYVETLFSGPSELTLPDDCEDRAVYLVEGALAIGDGELGEGEMAVVRRGASVTVRSGGPARAMLIGGRPFPERRTIWWNFVSSSTDRIEQAKRDWLEKRFDPVPGETEFIPLPE